MSEVLQGDCLVKLKEIADNSVDAIITCNLYVGGVIIQI